MSVCLCLSANTFLLCEIGDVFIHYTVMLTILLLLLLLTFGPLNPLATIGVILCTSAAGGWHLGAVLRRGGGGDSGGVTAVRLRGDEGEALLERRVVLLEVLDQLTRLLQLHRQSLHLLRLLRHGRAQVRHLLLEDRLLRVYGRFASAAAAELTLARVGRPRVVAVAVVETVRRIRSRNFRTAATRSSIRAVSFRRVSSVIARLLCVGRSLLTAPAGIRTRPRAVMPRPARLVLATATWW